MNFFLNFPFEIGVYKYIDLIIEGQIFLWLIKRFSWHFFSSRPYNWRQFFLVGDLEICGSFCFFFVFGEVGWVFSQLGRIVARVFVFWQNLLFLSQKNIEKFGKNNFSCKFDNLHNFVNFSISQNWGEKKNTTLIVAELKLLGLWNPSFT
jgi:hypothetical protein